MAEQSTISQAQQAVKDMGSEWSKLIAGSIAQLETFFGEIAKVESKTVAQVVVGFDEAGRVAKIRWPSPSAPAASGARRRSTP